MPKNVYSAINKDACSVNGLIAILYFFLWPTDEMHGSAEDEDEAAAASGYSGLTEKQGHHSFLFSLVLKGQ